MWLWNIDINGSFRYLKLSFSHNSIILMTDAVLILWLGSSSLWYCRIYMYFPYHGLAAIEPLWATPLAASTIEFTLLSTMRDTALCQVPPSWHHNSMTLMTSNSKHYEFQRTKLNTFSDVRATADVDHCYVVWSTKHPLGSQQLNCRPQVPVSRNNFVFLLPEASFGLRVLSLPASFCLCVCLSVCVCPSTPSLSAS